MRRLPAIGLGVLALALCAGCGAQSRAGSLVVGIEYTGGAWPAAGELTAGRVVIFDGHGHRVRALRVKEGQTAATELPPGQYSLGFGQGRPTVKQLLGCQPRIATVNGGSTTDYTLQLGCWPSTPEGVLASVEAAALAESSVRVTESFAADLYGTDHRTFDVGADSGKELFDYYGHTMRVLLVDHTVYVRADASLLSGSWNVPGLDMTESQAKRYAGKWISIPEGDKVYTGLAKSLTLSAAVDAGVPTSSRSEGPLTTYTPAARLSLSRQSSHAKGVLALQWTAGPQPPPLDVLKARATGAPLPVSFADYTALMVFFKGTYSRWNEPVHVHAPARSIAIATVRGS